MNLISPSTAKRGVCRGPGSSGRVLGLFMICIAGCFPAGCGADRVCPDTPFDFRHAPSDYYGAGQFFGRCPTGDPIRCYHYHRHWICEKNDTLYWDRNLETAARSACGCPPRPGTRPAAPARSGNPDRRVF